VVAKLDDKDLCATLLAYGEDVNLPSGDPELSPLGAACRKGSADVVEMLLNNGAKAPTNGFSLLGEFMKHWMQSRSRVKAARILSLLNEHGVKMDFESDGTCLPAVHEAARYGNLPVLKELLALGADINTWAGEHSNILHKRDVNPNALCDKYPNPFISAVSVAAADRDYTYTIPEELEILIRHGANVRTHGPAALELATANGYDEDVRRLLGEVVDEVHESEEDTG
jgi:ankyrin repeat protein